DPSGQGWSLGAYQLLLDNSSGTGPAHRLPEAFFTSLTTATDASILAMVMGLLAAIVLSRSRERWLKIIDTIMMLPLGISAVTVGFGFLLTLSVFPVELRTSSLLVPIVQALVATPLVIRIVLPTLQAINPRLRESARTLGASPVRVWLAVDLPMALRSFVTAAGFAYVVALGEFGATSFLTRPDSPTLPVLIGQLIARPGAENVSAAMAGATILLVLTIAVVFVVETARTGEWGEF
ncbi:MAG: ABC transporter permease, partial [Mycobacteriaceae bacterium]